MDLKNIQELTLGYNFNQSIKKLNLKNVYKLKFGWKFNQPIMKLIFPSSLKLLSVSQLHPEYELINIKELYKYRCRAKIEMVRIYYWYCICSKRYNKLFINYGSKIDILMYLPENEDLGNWLCQII